MGTRDLDVTRRRLVAAASYSTMKQLALFFAILISQLAASKDLETRLSIVEKQNEKLVKFMNDHLRTSEKLESEIKRLGKQEFPDIRERVTKVEKKVDSFSQNNVLDNPKTSNL